MPTDRPDNLPPGTVEWFPEHYLCPRCQCCDLMWEQCAQCGGEGHTQPGDLYEIDPLWYGEDETRPCQICDGMGGWLVCGGRCDEHGQHQSEKRAV